MIIERKPYTQLVKEVDKIKGDFNPIASLAKGANKAISYGDYETMITAFNCLTKDAYNIGQSIMIVTLNVPDLWISGIVGKDEFVTYTYVDDDTFVNAIKANNGKVQVGYYLLSALETQKVDLEGYVKPTDYAESQKGGVVKVSYGNSHASLWRGNDGLLRLGNDNSLIENKTTENAIRNKDLDYAIKVGLTTNTETLNVAEKAKAQEWLGLKLYEHRIEIKTYDGAYSDIGTYFRINFLIYNRKPTMGLFDLLNYGEFAVVRDLKSNFTNVVPKAIKSCVIYDNYTITITYIDESGTEQSMSQSDNNFGITDTVTEV